MRPTRNAADLLDETKRTYEVRHPDWGWILFGETTGFLTMADTLHVMNAKACVFLMEQAQAGRQASGPPNQRTRHSGSIHP